MTFAETMHWSRHVWQDREEESEEEWGRRSTFRSMMLNYYNFEAI